MSKRCHVCGMRGDHKLSCPNRWYDRRDDSYYNITEEAWQASSPPSETGDGSGSSSESSQD